MVPLARDWVFNRNVEHPVGNCGLGWDKPLSFAKLLHFAHVKVKVKPITAAS